LIEKPLVSNISWNLTELENRANSANIFMYTAYNHRFEPHFKSVKNVLESQELGKIFSIKMFYGNGTSQLVKSSNWRDTGMGVISDLAPHLLDTLAFWFGIKKLKNLFIISHNFETKAPDHAVIHFSMEEVEVELEMSLCMWRNTFNCDIIGEKGSLHISSLCKWGPSILTQRKRVFPSGVPDEVITRLEMPDPTWELEHEHFNSQIKKQSRTNLSTDFWIAESLSDMESML
jgi:predicted dehydrogenase